MYGITIFCLLFNTYDSNISIILTLTIIRMSFHKYIKNIKINKYIWIINLLWNNILIFTPGLNHRHKKEYYSIIKNRKKNEKKVFYRGYTSHVRHNAYNIMCWFVLVIQQVGNMEQGCYWQQVPQRDYFPRYLTRIRSLLGS